MNQTGSIQKFTRVAFAGLCISFLGALPLGTMNIAATHISIQQGTHAGLVYAFGSMLVEIIVVRIVLVAMDWLAKRHKIFRLLELVTTGLIVALAAASFIAAYKMKSFSGAIPISRSLSPFWTGVLLSAANPLHIPFWLGWSTVLLNKNILLPSAGYYNWYITGIGTGYDAGFYGFCLWRKLYGITDNPSPGNCTLIYWISAIANSNYSGKKDDYSSVSNSLWQEDRMNCYSAFALYSQFFHPGFQCGGIQTQHFRSAFFATYFPACFFEYLCDVFLFYIFHF